MEKAGDPLSGNPIEEQKHSFSLKGQGDTHLACTTYLPKGKTKASVLIAHGYAEHMGRYNHVVQAFLEKDIAVSLLDHRGHGLSGGPRANVLDFDDFARDFAVFAEKVLEDQEKTPYFLFGHSMGCPILLRYLDLFQAQEHFRGLILSGAALIVSQKVSPLLIKMSGLISSLLPHLPVAEFDSEGLSRDPDVITRYMADPLTYTKKTKARIGTCLLNARSLVEETLSEITLPLLLLHGGGDRIISPESSRLIADKAGSEDITLTIYPELFHEILNEPEWQTVMEDILSWVEKHEENGENTV